MLTLLAIPVFSMLGTHIQPGHKLEPAPPALVHMEWAAYVASHIMHMQCATSSEFLVWLMCSLTVCGNFI